MMTIKQIREELQRRNVSSVARALGMHRQQLWAIAKGITKNPVASTVERISDYLEACE